MRVHSGAAGVQVPLKNQMEQDLFITGTDTNVGKTILSSMLCAALDRVYWKPIQTGIADDLSDTATVICNAGIPESQTIPPTYCFDPPVSPHLAAQWKGVRIDLNEIKRPQTGARLIIEGAGGVLVPLNETNLTTDLMKSLDVPVLIASRTKLGTINHTLLTIQALRAAAVPIKGVVLIGIENEDNRRAIEHYGQVAVLGRIPMLDHIHRKALIDVFSKHFERSTFE